jgi:hypothetical protein
MEERRIPERDWRLFHSLHATFVDRFCQRVLDELSSVISDAGQTPHRRYLRLWKILKKRDNELGCAFDAPRRSMALTQMASVRAQGLLTDEEFGRFSEETQQTVQTLLSIVSGESR